LSPHNEAQLKKHAPVGKSVTDFEVSNCGKTDCFPQCKATQLAPSVMSRRRNNLVAVRGITDITGRANGSASVEFDPKQRFVTLI
jgi:hypothetical protein